MKILNVKTGRCEVYADGDVLINAIKWLKANKTYLLCSKNSMEVRP